MVDVSGPGKTYALLNLINHELDVNNFLNSKDSSETKCQLLINKRKGAGLIWLNHSKSFIGYAIDMDDIYKKVKEYNLNKKRKIFIVFDDMIADMLSNKMLNLIVTELFIRGGKLNISLFYHAILFPCFKKY